MTRMFFATIIVIASLASASAQEKSETNNPRIEANQVRVSAAESAQPLAKAHDVPAPAAAKAPEMSPEKLKQLQDLLFERAGQILPAPGNGMVHSLTQTSKLGTPPSGGCRKLIGTKHDPETHGTYQIWKRC